VIKKIVLLLTVLGMISLYGQDITRKGKWQITNQITTTNLKPWVKKNGGAAKSTSGFNVNINLRDTISEIDGFGGCFNEMGWKALLSLSPTERNKVLQNLFDPVNGAGFTICRMPLGANDYSLEWYSYDETPGDFELRSFSNEHDKEYLIPYIKAALKLNPRLNLWASPWCPPSWMKINGNYACWPSKKYNTLQPELAGKEMKTMFRMEKPYLNAYALYFSKFIKMYKENGISISAVHVQNEPNSSQIFPSCIWEPKDLALFIGRYLGPVFEKEKINANIWLGTIERPHPERVTGVLEDKEASKYIKGVGFQWAGKDAIPIIHKEYPSLKLMQTETECGDGANDWKAMEYTFGLVKHYLNNGASAYLYWNMVLDETGLSRWGWKQNSMISINPEKKTVRYNPEYYLMKHLGLFVKPKSKLIKPEGDFEDLLAFSHSGKVVLIMLNKSKNVSSVTVNVGGGNVFVNLEPESITTAILTRR